jgi:YfiH family protein
MFSDFLYFSSFDNPALRHAITTRGLSSQAHGPYDGLNLAFHVKDEAARVVVNRHKLAQTLGFETKLLHAAQQTHGDHAQIVTCDETARGALDWESAWPATDALVTRDTQVPLLILVADCAPILLADFEAHVVAVVHAGWRGATACIASQTVATMCSLGARPEGIRAGIGPHLCAACFETGEDVAQMAYAIAPESVLRGDVKPHLSLDALLRSDLESCGVGQIETLPQCPRCDNATFFSHRAQNGVSGRFGLVAWWED